MKLLLIFCAIFYVASARPTFDKIANALLDLVDEPHVHYDRPPYGRPPHEPLIQEGYEHGYDYHYGGGSVVGAGQYSHGRPQQGYYPGPRVPVQQPIYNPGPYPAPYPQYPAQSPPYGGASGNYGGYQDNYLSGGSEYGGSGGYHAYGYKNRGY